MLGCGHDKKPFGAPVCVHLRIGREPWLSYLRWYTGHGMDMELLCSSCVAEREKGQSVTTEFVCQECFEFATTEIGDLEGVRGKPEIHIRSEAFNPQLRMTALPTEVGKIVDISPIISNGRSIWLLLAEDGWLVKFDASTGAWNRLASTSLAPEPDHQPWCGHILKRHLHSSPCGDFAAIVNDYGRCGQIIDLKSGQVTLALDGITIRKRFRFRSRLRRSRAGSSPFIAPPGTGSTCPILPPEPC